MLRRPAYRQRTTRGSGMKLRLIIAGAIVLFTFVSYMGQSAENPITGEKQRVALNPQEEIALGLQSAPAMAQQHGGLYPDENYQAIVDQVGNSLVQALEAKLANDPARSNPYQFDFHLLEDRRAINAFALPGGQCFITYALFEKLLRDRPSQYGGPQDRLAGVLAHEVGHVIARHGSQRIAKQKLTQGLVGAASVGGGSYQSGQVAAMVGKMVNMKYGRSDELESDKWGVALADAAGYDARAMMDVMDILDESAAGGGPPEMMSTHPKPANRKAYVKEILRGAGVAIE